MSHLKELEVYASNIRSGAASRGQVLVADGNGGAAWETSGGSGGANFVFDGIAVAWGTKDGFGNVPFTLTLTKNGLAIAEHAWCVVFAQIEEDGSYSTSLQEADATPMICVVDISEFYRPQFHYVPANAPYSLQLNNPSQGVHWYILVPTPSGGVAMSDTAWYEEMPPPP